MVNPVPSLLPARRPFVEVATAPSWASAATLVFERPRLQYGVKRWVDARQESKVIKHALSGLKAVLAFDNWPTLVLSRLLDRKTGYVIYRKKGLELLVDHHGGDENGTRECIVSDMYSRYLPLLRTPKSVRVLDLGANGGGFPLMLKINGVEVKKAVCVEMNPLTSTRLKLNLATNIGPAAIAINAAVCNMPEESSIRLKPSRGGTSESILNSQADSADAFISVPTTTFEALYRNFFENEPIDICKVDIEGAEYEVFASCSDGLLQKIRYLLIEFHDRSQTPALIHRLTSLGFADMTAHALPATDNTEVRAFRGPAEMTDPARAAA